MKNIDKWQEIIVQVRKLPQSKQNEFLFYTLGAMKSNFEFKNVKEKSVIDACVLSLKLVNESEERRRISL